MDPISVLQHRIEQLEAKLGSVVNDGQRGDSIAENLVNSASNIQNAMAGNEKLQEAAVRATELNNYMEPKLAEKIQHDNINLNEVVAAEPLIQHHCQCMRHYQQLAPVMESNVMHQIPVMQATIDNMQENTAQMKVESDAVSNGVIQLAETCGSAASNAAESLVEVAQKVEKVEKLTPRRRNGLD